VDLPAFIAELEKVATVVINANKLSIILQSKKLEEYFNPTFRVGSEDWENRYYRFL